MKRGKRFVSFLLALVMTCSLMVNAGAAEAQEEIQAYLSYDITVTYNGEVQTMTDAAGNAVYPVSYNGTTYLPVRAVSNMLGVAVAWDQATQTVLLQGIVTSEPNGPNDAFYGAKTSENATIINETCICYEWVEIDWNNANDGYVRVKLNEEFAFFTSCYIRWVNDKGRLSADWFRLRKSDWVKIPLLAGSQEYVIQVAPMVSDFDDPDLTDEELEFIDGHVLSARFTAEIADDDTIWTVSHLRVDYENSPNTCAKALELTKDCKTDAEKITAIFNWVSNRQNIKYDTAEANKSNAEYKAGKRSDREFNDSTRDLNPDHILQSKKGVCEHYAVLMAAMLRSLGIPCKVVCGKVSVPEGNNPGHAWVAVRPETGTLNMSALGAGNDYSIPNHVTEKPEPTGWIRLDPTNANNKAFTSNDENYKATDCY